jgi:hypothetical protein
MVLAGNVNRFPQNRANAIPGKSRSGGGIQSNVQSPKSGNGAQGTDAPCRSWVGDAFEEFRAGWIEG